MRNDHTSKQIMVRASIDKMEKNRPQRLEEVKIRREDAKQQYEMANKQTEEFKKAVKEFKNAEEAEKTISFNEKMSAQAKSKNEELQRTADQQSAALEKLEKLKLT